MSKDNINERIKKYLVLRSPLIPPQSMVKVQITIKSITQDQLLSDLGQEIIKSLSCKMNEATFEASRPNKSIQNALHYLFTSRRSLRRQCQHQTGGMHTGQGWPLNGVGIRQPNSESTKEGR